MASDAGQVELPELQATPKPQAAVLPQPLPVEAAARPHERAEPRRPAQSELQAAVPARPASPSQGPPQLAAQVPVTVVQQPELGLPWAPRASRPEAQLLALA